MPPRTWSSRAARRAAVHRPLRLLLRTLLAAATCLLTAAALAAPGDEIVDLAAPPSIAVRTTGLASWYGAAHQGRRTASGQAYDARALTAAHRTLPLDTRLRVTNLANGRKVTVRVSDRGPFRSRRIIDLSRAAAARLGLVRQGVGRVKIEILREGALS
jgi:rare lipoprotein A